LHPFNKITNTWVLKKLNDYFISVSLINYQKMQCVVYHNVQKEEDGNNSTRTWKGLFVYDKEHDTIAMN
jgi:hypothetical protein